MRRLPMALMLLLALLPLAVSGTARAQTGGELVRLSVLRHASPSHVYEEQALVMTDRMGQHTVRTTRHYARREGAGRLSLMIMETPAESRGVSLFIDRESPGGVRHGAAPSSTVFGSNFSVADIEEEQPQDFHYLRETDQDLDRVPHYVVRASPIDETVARETGYRERRLYLRKDNLFVSRIDYQDREGRLARRQTFRDPRPDESGTWRAGMILMEDLREGRRSLLKIERRIHSPDYVPAAVFSGLRGQSSLMRGLVSP